jgi:guanylate kinase
MTSGSLEGMNERADELIDALRSAARPLLVVISGPSGVGKDTVIQEMRELLPAAYYAVTATTRERRPGEVNNVHYEFYSIEQFEQHLAANEFLEHATVYGNLYGVPKAPIRDALRRGRDVVVKVDPQGAQTIRQIAPEALLIFILPPSMAELARRLRSRKTDDLGALERRINIASREIATSEHFDYFVINDTVEQAVEDIQEIIAVEKRRIHPREVALPSGNV